MRRRFNYTGRTSIPQKNVSIVVTPGSPPTFSVGWRLDDLGLPPDARVYVEAFSSGSPTVVRYAWGTVDEPQPPGDTSLNDIAGDNIAFNLKVVDESEHLGRLWGVSRNIKPLGVDETEGGGRQPILPVNATDLGQQVWRLRFAHDRPWLEVNKNIDGIKDSAAGDPKFFGLVYPQIIRRVLMEILIFGDEYDPHHGSLDDWRVQWMRWAMHWHPDGTAPPASDPDGDQRKEWIEEVAESFCNRHEAARMFIEAIHTKGT